MSGKKCHCAKSLKEPTKPCPHQALTGQLYCGIHKNCQKQVSFQKKQFGGENKVYIVFDFEGALVELNIGRFLTDLYLSRPEEYLSEISSDKYKTDDIEEVFRSVHSHMMNKTLNKVSLDEKKIMIDVVWGGQSRLNQIKKLLTQLRDLGCHLTISSRCVYSVTVAMLKLAKLDQFFVVSSELRYGVPYEILSVIANDSPYGEGDVGKYFRELREDPTSHIYYIEDELKGRFLSKNIVNRIDFETGLFSNREMDYFISTFKSGQTGGKKRVRRI